MVGKGEPIKSTIVYKDADGAKQTNKMLVLFKHIYHLATHTYIYKQIKVSIKIPFLFNT
jgi:hypothetical protein